VNGEQSAQESEGKMNLGFGEFGHGPPSFKRRDLWACYYLLSNSYTEVCRFRRPNIAPHSVH
jgi:hypothetical protein